MATPSLAELKNRPQAPVTEPDFLNVSKGRRSWLLTLDHKRIGMMMLPSAAGMPGMITRKTIPAPSSVKISL